MGKKGKWPVFLLFIITLTISCNETPPDIVQVYSQGNLIRNPGNGTVTMGVSLFLHVEDEDGIDDIDRIYIIQDEEELFWELDSDTWAEIEQDNVVWLGSSGIFIPSFLPGFAGTFRVVVADSAGERTEAETFITFPETVKESSFPELQIDNKEKISIRGRSPDHILWFYTRTGSLAGSNKHSSKEIILDSLFPNQRTIDDLHHCYVYAYDDDIGAGLVAGPYLFE